MKVLVVLVLAVFTAGCNARMLAQNNPSRQGEMMKNAFWEYVSKATTVAEESLKQIQQSELGKELNTLISQSTESVSRFSDALRTQVAPLTQDLMNKFTREARQMRKRLDKDMITINNRLKPYAQELMTDFQKQVDELQKQATTFAETMDAESLKAMFVQRTQEMNQDLQAQMGPYAEEMRQKMEESFGEFRSKMMVLSENFEMQVNQKAQGVQQSLAPYGEELRAKFDLEAQNMKEQLEMLWKSFTKMMQ